MELLIDDANLEKIAKLAEYYPIDGVTTNPAILARYPQQKPYELLKKIRALIGASAQLHVQVVATEAAAMLEDAKAIQAQLGTDTYIKIPSVPEGFKAMRELHRLGGKITATVVYTPMQAYLAAKCGADYVAPYVNRIDNLGYDGIGTTKAIHDLLQNNRFATKVLAASFKNSQQVLELCKYGVGAATAAPDVIEAFSKNAAITQAIDDFNGQFAALAGTGKTMADC